MNKAIIAVVAVVLIAAGGAFALMSGKSDDDTAKKNTTSTTSTPESQADTTTSTAENSTETAESATITYTNDGFSPSSLKVTAGSKVTVKNDSTRALQFDSDPHPQHTDDPELNIGIIGSGESKTIMVTKTGSHGFHNHLNDNDTGTLIVE